MKLSTYQKYFGIKAAQGAEVTPEILAKINKYSLRELTAEEVFVRKYLMAHNAVDRDNERFPEALIDDFAATLPGKSLLNGHDRWSLPLGLYFDATTEEITKEQFRALTGEEARLPDDISMVKILWGWIYMLKAEFNEAMTSNIDAGIYRHASIGFRASDIHPVKGPYENILYWEYSPPGEALEGSIVWLGAQPGATAQKRHSGDDPGSHTPQHNDVIRQKQKGGIHEMDKVFKILQRLFPGKTFTEDGLGDELKAALDAHAKTASDEAVATAVKPLNEKITELSPLAADGKVYRNGLVTQYVTLKAKLGEVAETPEAQDKVKAVASGYPIDFLKSETDALQKRVEEKFPAEPQTPGDMRQDKTGDKVSGTTDWKTSNPIVPDDEEEGK